MLFFLGSTPKRNNSILPIYPKSIIYFDKVCFYRYTLIFCVLGSLNKSLYLSKSFILMTSRMLDTNRISNRMGTAVETAVPFYMHDVSIC